MNQAERPPTSGRGERPSTAFAGTGAEVHPEADVNAHETRGAASEEDIASARERLTQHQEGAGDGAANASATNVERATGTTTHSGGDGHGSRAHGANEEKHSGMVSGALLWGWAVLWGFFSWIAAPLRRASEMAGSSGGRSSGGSHTSGGSHGGAH